jgi:D-serine dehydratase
MVCRRFGVPRVLMANQLIGRQAIRQVIAELEADPGFEFLCVVDSRAGVEALLGELRDHPLGRPFEVLLEGGAAGGRTGCRSITDALAVARAVAAAPELALVGVEGFEDVMGGGIADAEPKVEAFLEFLVETARACATEDLFAPGPVILSAGGSKYFDQVSRIFRGAGLGRPVEIVLRSGCYLSHDSKIYTEAFARLSERTPEVEQLGEGLRPALELWAAVQSTPEPGLAVLTMGKRDVSHDLDLPIPKQWYRPGLHASPQDLGARCRVSGLYDQHTCLRAPADSPLRVGDLVSFGISHPCTTFDKWRLLYVVDDDYTVTEAIRTFF